MITAMNAGGRFTTCADAWHRVLRVHERRDLLRAAGLGQRKFAAELAVALDRTGLSPAGLIHLPRRTLNVIDSARQPR